LTFPVWSQSFFDLLVTRHSIRYFLQKAFAGVVPDAVAEYAYLTAHRPGARHAPLAFISGQLFTPNILDYYAAVERPVLAFCDRSDYGPSELLPQFCADQPNWRMQCIPGTKAMPQFERQRETVAAIEEFLRESVAAA